MEHTLVGRFDPASLEYLRQVTRVAPVTFISDPLVYLSVPKFEDVEGLYGNSAFIYVKSCEVLYNPRSGISEFMAFLELTQPELTRFHLADILEYSDVDPKRRGNPKYFRPYFTWLLDPNRSMRVQRYTVSVSHVLVANRHPLRLHLSMVSSDSKEAEDFNESTLMDNANPFLY